MSPSPTIKFSVGSRKGSLYNWTPPSTPSFRERYYLVSGPRRGRAAEVLLELVCVWGGDFPGAACGAGLGSLAPLHVGYLGVFRYLFFLDAGPFIRGGC